jgi:hypothetical protein
MCWEEEGTFMAVQTEVDAERDPRSSKTFGSVIWNRLPLVTAIRDSYEFLLDYMENKDPALQRQMLSDAAGASTRQKWDKLAKQQEWNDAFKQQIETGFYKPVDSELELKPRTKCCIKFREDLDV